MTTTKALERELEKTQSDIAETQQAVDKSVEFDLDRVTKIAALKEHEQRTVKRLADAQRVEAQRQAERDRKRLTEEYRSTCQAVQEKQDAVEKLVSAVIAGADELRELRRTLESATARLQKAGAEIPERPPTPLWQKHGGSGLAYCETVKFKLRNL